MPGCSVIREVLGTTARYVISGKFEGACAWDLSQRLEQETLPEMVVDFSQVSDFVDYGIAVVASALLALPPARRIEMRGLRQHQARLFRYFGVDPEELAHRTVVAPRTPQSTGPRPVRANEVA